MFRKRFCGTRISPHEHLCCKTRICQAPSAACKPVTFKPPAFAWLCSRFKKDRKANRKQYLPKSPNPPVANLPLSVGLQVQTPFRGFRNSVFPKPLLLLPFGAGRFFPVRMATNHWDVCLLLTLWQNSIFQKAQTPLCRPAARLGFIGTPFAKHKRKQTEKNL